MGRSLNKGRVKISYFIIVYVFSRAVVPTQSNVIEAGKDMMQDNEKEWYYGTGDERKGPIRFQEVSYVNIVNAASV